MSIQDIQIKQIVISHIESNVYNYNLLQMSQ